MSPRIRRIAPLMLIPALAALTLAAACSGSKKDEPKTPLGAVTATAKDPLPAEARAALDKGNVDYRSGKYADALASYRKAADAAPHEAAPYFGIFMAAQKLGNKALADSASKAIAQRNGTEQMLTDSSMQQLHASGSNSPKSGH